VSHNPVILLVGRPYARLIKQKPGYEAAVLTRTSERAAVGWLPCCVAALNDVISDACSLIDGVGLHGWASPALDGTRALSIDLTVAAAAAAAAACTCATQLGDVFISSILL